MQNRGRNRNETVTVQLKVIQAINPCVQERKVVIKPTFMAINI